MGACTAAAFCRAALLSSLGRGAAKWALRSGAFELPRSCGSPDAHVGLGLPAFAGHPELVLRALQGCQLARGGAQNLPRHAERAYHAPGVHRGGVGPRGRRRGRHQHAQALQQGMHVLQPGPQGLCARCVHNRRAPSDTGTRPEVGSGCLCTDCHTSLPPPNLPACPPAALRRRLCGLAPGHRRLLPRPWRSRRG